MRFRILLCTVTTSVLIAGWIVVNPRPVASWLDVGNRWNSEARQSGLPGTGETPARPIQTNYVLVLSGDNNARPFVAAELLNNKQADEVLITRPSVVGTLADSRGVPAHETTSQVLHRLGVPRKQIVVLQGIVDSTYDEARVARDFLVSQPDSQLIVVTSFCHTRRARWIFAQLFGDRMDRVSFVSAPYYDITPDNWWHNENVFAAVLSEYPKLAFYWLRYSRSRWWVGSLIVLSLVAMKHHGLRSLWVWLQAAIKGADRVAIRDQDSSDDGLSGGTPRKRRGSDEPGNPARTGRGIVSFTAASLLCWSLVVAVAVACCWPVPILQRLAAGLTTSGEVKDMDYVVIRSADGLRPSSDRCYDVAARLHREDPSRDIVLISAQLCPVVRIGAAPSFFDLSRRELSKRGVSAAAVTSLPTNAKTREEEAVALGDWLGRQSMHPNGRCVFLCNGFDARSWRYLFDGTNTVATADCIDVLGLSDRGIDESNWWRSRHGFTATFSSFAKLAYCYFHTERRSG